MEYFSIDLPDIFPQGIIEVEDEPHTYKVYEDGEEEAEYTLEKAPIERIVSVSGTSSGTTIEFSSGDDYVLSDDKERIVWVDGERPDADTTFYVTYRAESIISRYISSSEDELQTAEDKLIEAIQTKLVDKAEGDELDEIGKLFGPEIGKRRGRNNDVYRIYLKSVVQSFISRGTKRGIATAVGAATGINPDDIEIVEDFEDSSYEVSLPPTSAHAASTIEDVAEIADPSGIDQILTRYQLPTDEMSIDDELDYRVANAFISDEFGVTDSVETEPGTYSLSDESGASDTITIGTETIVSETGGIDDTVAYDETIVIWDSGTWDEMTWQ